MNNAQNQIMEDKPKLLANDLACEAIRQELNAPLIVSLTAFVDALRAEKNLQVKYPVLILGMVERMQKYYF